MRNAIPARPKLEVALRFLATGDSYQCIIVSHSSHNDIKVYAGSPECYNVCSPEIHEGVLYFHK